MGTRALLSLGVVFSATIFWIVGTMADEPPQPLEPPMSKTAPSGDKNFGDGYWTKDKIESAKPIELPTPANEPNQTEYKEKDDSRGESQSGVGSQGD